jgi:ElaB/YqjD/DUF883 family membrane-anchored ribosome-binding protein
MRPSLGAKRRMLFRVEACGVWTSVERGSQRSGKGEIMTRARSEAKAVQDESEPDAASPDEDMTQESDSDGAMEPPWVGQARELAEQTRVWVAANPFAALAAAVGAGFVLGRIFRR